MELLELGDYFDEEGEGDEIKVRTTHISCTIDSANGGSAAYVLVERSLCLWVNFLFLLFPFG